GSPTQACRAKRGTAERARNIAESHEALRRFVASWSRRFFGRRPPWARARDKRLSVEETHRMPGRVPLARALSKLGICSRSEAIARILDGRVAVGGVVVRDPGRLVVPESARITVDGAAARRGAWRMLMLNKARGTVTTRRD